MANSESSANLNGNSPLLSKEEEDHLIQSTKKIKSSEINDDDTMLDKSKASLVSNTKSFKEALIERKLNEKEFDEDLENLDIDDDEFDNDGEDNDE
ncbi:hypothetical protein ACSBR2_016486 [Camellia fascicularis]